MNTSNDAPEWQSNLDDLLAALMARALGMDNVGIHDDFFELGGSSIIATRLLASLDALFPGKVPSIVTFLESPTVADLSCFIVQRSNDTELDSIASVVDSFIAP